MEQIFNIFSNLDVRFHQGLPSKSNHSPPTAVYQFVAKHANKFLVQTDANDHFQFEAVYKHNGKFYPHPYTLRKVNCLVNNTLGIEHYREPAYEILLYLELKRLRDFDIDDLKRYYAIIDKSIDSNEEIHDFHDVYLNLHYVINGQSNLYQCNHGQPIHLPKFISNQWTDKNTLTRFRYDAENRDGTFPCEMTLRYGDIANLQSYKIVLCLTSNTIPARMDYHAIRWICKLKPKVTKQNGSSIRSVDKEKSHCLNHPSGIVIAKVFGPEMKFTSQMLHPINNLNYVRSCFEPEGFRAELQASDNKDNSAFAIVVTKGTDYPFYMKNRRKDNTILRYLPFNELENVDSNLETKNESITKSLKHHKDECGKQLIFFDENEKGTFSQAHVRLYVAAYDEHDILLTEALNPPLRNNKAFEQLRIIRIVQPRNDLRANEPAYVYCDYDYSRSKPERDPCPYEFELVFTRSSSTPNENQLLQLFNKPDMCINASYVPNCPCLLQFQVPNEPRYNHQRVFIRLRHTKSKDYNPSVVALSDTECWMYYADATSVTDLYVETNLYPSNDPMGSDLANVHEDIELQIRPINEPLSLDYILDSDSTPDSNDCHRRMSTPDIDSKTSKRFSFTNISSQQDNHE